MGKLTVKDFKYFNKKMKIVATDTKKLLVLPYLPEDRVVYHVHGEKLDAIHVFKEFAEALKFYNELP